MLDDFDVKDGWTLLNDYTIERSQKENGERSHMLTCVPSQIRATLSEFRCNMSVAWAERHRRNRFKSDLEGNVLPSGNEDSQKGPFEQRPTVSAKATFQDRVTVFSIENGRELELENPVELHISSIPAGLVGGKHSATFMDGIEFSGIKARKLPDNGLMEDEPGRLWVNGDGSAELHLCLDEDVFHDAFWQIAANLNRLHSVVMDVTVELFIDEMEAALNEGDFPYHYGILMNHTSVVVATAARLDDLRLSFRPESSQTTEINELGTVNVDDEAGNPDPTPTDRFHEEQLSAIRHTNRLLTWAIVGLTALSVILLFSR